MNNKPPALNGPCCHGSFALSPGGARCDLCGKEYRFAEFPAFRAERVVARPRAVADGDDATCFFHAKNQAETVCPGCGRFLCAVCAVDFGGRVLCPSCIAAGKADSARAVKDKWLPDGLALLLSTAPLIVWPCTLATAPAALALVFLNWNKPAGLVRRFRWQRWVALALSLAQLCGWTWIFVKLFSSPA